jgi:hypothetical protein
MAGVAIPKSFKIRWRTFSTRAVRHLPIYLRPRVDGAPG